MGISLSLHVAHDIAPARWAEAWDETLRVLERFPMPLMRLAWDTIPGRYGHIRKPRTEPSAAIGGQIKAAEPKE